LTIARPTVPRVHSVEMPSFAAHPQFATDGIFLISTSVDVCRQNRLFVK
jgi:hypothetical protein